MASTPSTQRQCTSFILFVDLQIPLELQSNDVPQGPRHFGKLSSSFSRFQKFASSRGILGRIASRLVVVSEKPTLVLDAAEALRLGGFLDAVILNATLSTLDLLVEIVGLLSRSDFAKLLLLLWNMWNRRNCLVHDSHLQLVWATVTTTVLHEDFLAANDLM
ncbi:hypothetical protein V6N11_046202 [Hibiscus sabdariffa]|uniref:Uncharacterized protein n=2 Tax=Hibiscus sabdariffa TaxID=183260 RepID=A0ABR1ZC75_9ROSI